MRLYFRFFFDDLLPLPSPGPSCGAMPGIIPAMPGIIPAIPDGIIPAMPGGSIPTIPGGSIPAMPGGSIPGSIPAGMPSGIPGIPDIDIPGIIPDIIGIPGIMGICVIPVSAIGAAALGFGSFLDLRFGIDCPSLISSCFRLAISGTVNSPEAMSFRLTRMRPRARLSRENILSCGVRRARAARQRVPLPHVRAGLALRGGALTSQTGW